MAVNARFVSKDIAEKAKIYLQQAGEVKPEMQEKYGQDTYFYSVYFSAGADEGLGIDAALNITGNKISIIRIWRLVHSMKSGRYEPVNLHGDTGKDAKLLSEKYLNRFLDELENVDINNITARSFNITVDMVSEIEAEIDKSINYPHISDADIKKYERLEFIEMGKSALKQLMVRIGAVEYSTDYNQFTNAFEAFVPSFKRTISIPFSEVVRKKWETGNGFLETLYECAKEQLHDD